MMSEESTCSVCGKVRPKHQCKVITLRPDEIKVLSLKNVTECAYCQPCWKVLTDPVMGPNYMSSLLSMFISQIGVPNADRLALKYRAWLTKKAIKPG